jgi:hypothetical protein
VCFAGVAQSVEHLFCKQVVRGSSPRVSSRGALTGAAEQSVTNVSKVSESCPSGQREQAVNLPAYAYAGSNPALSTSAPLRGASVSIICLGELSSPSAEVKSAEPPPQVLGPQPQNFRGVAGTTIGTVRSGLVSTCRLGSAAPPRRSEIRWGSPVFGSLPQNFRGVAERAFVALCAADGVDTFSNRLAWGTKRASVRSRVRSLRVLRVRAGVAQLVERQPSKLNVEGSSPFSRSGVAGRQARSARHVEVTQIPAHLAQLVEHVLGKDEVTSSILVVGSKQ